MRIKLYTFNSYCMSYGVYGTYRYHMNKQISSGYDSFILPVKVSVPKLDAKLLFLDCNVKFSDKIPSVYFEGQVF